MISPLFLGTLRSAQALLLVSALVESSLAGLKAGLRDLSLPFPPSLSLPAGVNEDLINAGTLAQVPFSRL